MTTRKIQVVNTAAMSAQSALFAAMESVAPAKLSAMKGMIRKIVNERVAYEAQRERRLANGSVVVGQSNDIRHVEALAESEAFARMCCALSLNPRAYIHPSSQKEGKTSNQTSNLKAYKKAREIAESIYIGSSSLENVVKVATVCMYRAATMRGAVIERDFAETFLSSVELRTIKQGSEDLWNAIDEVRAKHMTTGAATQTSQMIRTLVALGAAQDVQDGRSKNVRLDPDAPVLHALMTRFGVVEMDAPEAVEQPTV